MSKRSGDSGRPAAQPAGVGAKKGSKQPYEPQRLGEALLEAFLEKEGEGLELSGLSAAAVCVTGPVCLPKRRADTWCVALSIELT